MEIQIDEMKLEDLNCIKNILLTDFDDFWNYDIFKTELESKNSKYIIAKMGNEIVGFAGVKIVFEQADIMNIVTKKNYRNKGIGSLLLKSLIDICKDFNVSSIMLEVDENNLSAIHLYRKFEFEILNTRKNYYGISNALIMRKKF